jgi:ABC-2 type transport system ATP-binding protein
MDEKPVVQLRKVSKSFFLPHEKNDTLVEYATNPVRRFKPRGDVFEVLKNINLDVQKGEFVGIMGRNGSGKSTLLKIIAQIYQPTSGKVSIQGSLVPFLELGVGFNPELTARDNIFLNGIILGVRKNLLAQKFREIIEFAELEKFVEVPLKNYSSGMQVRLAFAVAIMADADIYLLDEVLAVGDVIFQEKCFDVFKDYKKQRKTVILVSHAPEAVKKFCDRAVFLKDGHMHEYDNVKGAIDAYLAG